MKITDLLKKESIDLNVKASSKKEVIEKAVKLMEHNGNIKDKQKYLELVIKREEEGLTVVGLQCKHCGKNFGVAFLGISNFDVKNYEPLEVQEGPEPINYDDVIDAHRFIKNLDADWQKHLPQ